MLRRLFAIISISLVFCSARAQLPSAEAHLPSPRAQRPSAKAQRPSAEAQLPSAEAQRPPTVADLPRSPTGADLPTPEEFINAVYSTVVDSTQPHYYLIMGTDSCRFLKYDYDEWINYHLMEPLPFQTLNELSKKVYLSPKPYFWNQNRLRKAICITRRQADSILSANPVFAHKSATTNENFVYSFSLPCFTDDGQFAVIDLNVICGAVCGAGYTCVFRLTTTGEWKLVGKSTNWSS